MSYYISRFFEVVRAEHINLAEKIQLEQAGNYFTDESKAQDVARKIKEIIYESNRSK